MDDRHGHAEEAGDEMGSELDAIQERLRALKRKLDARESVVSLDDEIADGDVLAMNPLTAGESDGEGDGEGDDATGADVRRQA